MLKRDRRHRGDQARACRRRRIESWHYYGPAPCCVTQCRVPDFDPVRGAARARCADRRRLLQCWRSSNAHHVSTRTTPDIEGVIRPVACRKELHRPWSASLPGLRIPVAVMTPSAALEYGLRCRRLIIVDHRRRRRDCKTPIELAEFPGLGALMSPHVRACSVKRRRRRFDAVIVETSWRRKWQLRWSARVSRAHAR